MAGIDQVPMEITGLQNQTIVKEPGSINGEALVISNLEACEIYILDFLDMVEVKNVRTSKIFIGPVDGAAIFEEVAESHIAVAAQHIQAKSVLDTHFDIFTSSKPSLDNCSGVKIGCWRGAYPGLTSHFQEANLDPKQNLWDQATDISQNSLVPAFELVHDTEEWVAPFDDAFAEPENPVPYSGAPAAGGADFTGGFGQGLANGHAEDGFQESSEHPKLTAINAKLRERQEAQETREREVKTELVQKAANYLEDFYKNRNSRVQSRSKQNRDAEQGITIAGLEGKTEWDKAVNLVNFNFSRPNGTDLSRFKNVLFGAKSKNVPISSKTTA